MNKKIQEMWDNAHDIPRGAFIPEGTVLIQMNPVGSSGEAELNYYAASVSAPWQGTSRTAPVRSADPIPDPDDTGTIAVHSSAGYIVLVDTYDDRCYDLSKNQARNLARKITEAIDVH